MSNTAWLLILGVAVLGCGGVLAYYEHQRFQLAGQYVEALALCWSDQAAGLARISELDRIHGNRGRVMFPPEMNDQLMACGPLTPRDVMRDVEQMLEDVR